MDCLGDEQHMMVNHLQMSELCRVANSKKTECTICITRTKEVKSLEIYKLLGRYVAMVYV
jgi:hypothetical protein